MIFRSVPYLRREGKGRRRKGSRVGRQQNLNHFGQVLLTLINQCQTHISSRHYKELENMAEFRFEILCYNIPIGKNDREKHKVKWNSRDVIVFRFKDVTR